MQMQPDIAGDHLYPVARGVLVAVAEDRLPRLRLGDLPLGFLPVKLCHRKRYAPRRTCPRTPVSCITRLINRFAGGSPAEPKVPRQKAPGPLDYLIESSICNNTGSFRPTGIRSPGGYRSGLRSSRRRAPEHRKPQSKHRHHNRDTNNTDARPDQDSGGAQDRADNEQRDCERDRIERVSLAQPVGALSGQLLYALVVAGGFLGTFDWRISHDTDLRFDRALRPIQRPQTC